jgi:hypothetical protein
MRRLLLTLGLVFTVIGLGALVACAVTLRNSMSFRADAVRTQGVIVDARWSDTDCDSSGCDRMYRPVVRFSTASGRQLTFTASGASDREPQLGGTVTVFYPAARPQDARIDRFLDFWLAPLITGIVGLVFTAVGLPLLINWIRRRRTDSWLADSGRRVSADLDAVRINPRLRINGVHPWQVHASWLDPATGQRYRFRSDNLMEDPRDLLGDRTEVDVIIDPGDPGGRYRVDLPI